VILAFPFRFPSSSILTGPSLMIINSFWSPLGNRASMLFVKGRKLPIPRFAHYSGDMWRENDHESADDCWEFIPAISHLVEEEAN
jgi:hypothetical protein